MCDPVTNITVDAATITHSGATVIWTPGENNGGNFEMEYGIHGFAHGAGTVVQVSATSYSLSGLTPETEYDVYVRALCDEQNVSEWSSVCKFRTSNVGIDAVNGNSEVTIYPNPAENNTTIRVSGVEGEVMVTIVDMNGRTVSHHTIECAGDCEKMVHVSNLAAGNYFVRLQGNGLNAIEKLVVK